MLKCTVDKSRMASVLSKVQGLTGRRSNLGITENILMRSVPEGIQITATDLETGFEGFYPALVESEGAIALNSRKLHEIIKEFPLDAVLFNEVENRWVEIGEGKILYHMMGMNPDDFPETDRLTDIEFFSIDAGVLEKMIARSIVITPASDEKRNFALGVSVERIPSDTTTCLRFVSTDVTRLNIMECLYEGNDAIPVGKNVLVSKKGLGDAIKFLDTDGDVQIGIKENAFIIRKASETLMLQLLEGEFPKYQNILEKRDSARIEMEKIPFSKLLKRMSIIATEKYNSAMFTFDNNTLTVSAVNPEYGESKEEMEISFSGAPVTAAFNPKFFIDTLNLLDHETVIVDIVDGNSACILKNDADPTFTSIIMPMRF